MKKSFFTLTLFLSSVIFSQVRFDTTSSRIVGPGIKHFEIIAPALPLTIDVLEIDLQNPFNKIESVKSDNKIRGYQTVSEMVQERTAKGINVVGAINGDFYSSGGIPIGKQISNGQIVKQNRFYSSLGVNKFNKPFLDLSTFNGVLITKNGGHEINDVNSTRVTDNLILYNTFHGSSTETNQYGTEIRIKSLSNWIVNDTIMCEVKEIEENVGNLNIAEGEAVISGHGISATFLSNNIALGDTVKIYLGFTPGIEQMDQLMGGYPRIIKDGVNYTQQGYNEEGGPPHTFERHPRSAIGFSQDSTKLFFVTVDGRGYSIGITLEDLADFMINLGVYNAMNLDGGGSTTMLVRDKITNVPSDGTERSVANGMLVYSTAPKTDTLSFITVKPNSLRLFKGEKASIKVEGWDKYFNPLNINVSQISYTVVSEVGTIDTNGNFTASETSSTGSIIVDYLGIKDTCNVVVKSIGRIELKPKEVLTNTTNYFEFSQTSWDIDGTEQKLSNDEFNWRVADTNIAKVVEPGIIKGMNSGSTKLYIEYENIADTALINVSELTGSSILHHFDTTENISVIGENLDLNNTHLEIIDNPVSEGNSSLKVVYQYVGSTSKLFQVHLSTNIEIEGAPDSIFLDLLTNGDKNQLIYLFEDDNNEKFQINVKKWAVESEHLDIQPGAFSNISTTQQGAIFNFPVTLTGLVIKLDGERENGITYKDSLIIDNLVISYPEIISSVENKNILPNKFHVYQNFPNPFNPTTTIKFNLPKNDNVSLKIYNILGEQVSDLLNEELKSGEYSVLFDGSELSSGIYFYRLKTNNSISIKKMILLK